MVDRWKDIAAFQVFYSCAVAWVEKTFPGVGAGILQPWGVVSVDRSSLYAWEALCVFWFVFLRAENAIGWAFSGAFKNMNKGAKVIYVNTRGEAERQNRA